MEATPEDPVTRRRPRRRRGLALRTATAALLAAAVLATSCARSAPADSGVRGRVWLGPLTPVQRVGGPPNEKPYAATVQVLKAGSTDVVATTHSGKDGFFQVDLAAGEYVLQGLSPSKSRLPRAAPVAVAVSAHHFVTAAVHFDTGIR
jgi:hypothetical protein